MLSIITVDISFGDGVTETPVTAGVELGVTMGDMLPVFPGVESVEDGLGSTSDVAWGVLPTLEADWVVVSSSEGVL